MRIEVDLKWIEHLYAYGTTPDRNPRIFVCTCTHDRCVMVAAGWSNEATDVLIIVLGEQNIQNQLDGVARNNKSCVRESFSHSKNAAMNFRRSSAYGTAVSFLKTASFFFSSFLCHIFFLFSRQFVFVMQPNDAKAKKQHYFKVARGIAML